LKAISNTQCSRLIVAIRAQLDEVEAQLTRRIVIHYADLARLLGGLRGVGPTNLQVFALFLAHAHLRRPLPRPSP
jgi:hypothetical protein